MLLIVERGIRGGICHARYRYAEGNNKYMGNYNNNNNNNKIISYVFRCKQYLWMAMSQKLSVSSYIMLKFNKEFIINYDKDRDKGNDLEVDVEYPKD